MVIVQSINSSYQFERAFSEAGRSNNFSHEGLEALYDYLDDLSEETGENIELDVIALCCEYTEESFDDIINNYKIDVSELDDMDDKTEDGEDEYTEEEKQEKKIEIVREFLEGETSIVGKTAEGFVFACF